MNRRVLFVAVFFSLPALKGELKPAGVFTDHMVLQRDARVPVWGTSTPGDAVRVEFAGQHKETRAGRDGRWRVDLDPLPASTVGEALTISSGRDESENGKRQFEDVLVGEVWLCSGQSNMAWTVRENGVSVARAAEEEAAADYPLIRQLKVPKSNAREPGGDFRAEWTVCSPKTVGTYSGVGFFFARNLFQKLGVPVGIINSSYGGTPIEAWLSAGTFQTDPSCLASRTRFAETEARWPEMVAAYRAASAAWEKEDAEARATGAKLDRAKPRQPVGPGHPYSPTTVYNAMVHPLVPYAIRGAIWYQGEANVKFSAEYQGLLTALIRQWRNEWKQGDYPFYFVQLANFRGEDPEVPDWAWLREAQAETLSVKNTGMAVTIDIGQADDIHPRNKQDVGRRLALLALNRTYAVYTECSGPALVRSLRDGQGMTLVFDHAEGLELKGTGPAFEVAGADRRFAPATAEVRGRTVFVCAPDVREPVAVRYAWRNAPEATLFNAAGLPAPPFRTDDWPSSVSPP